MTEQFSRFIEHAWREQQVPLIDGVLFATGAFYPVEYYAVTLRDVAGAGARVSTNVASHLEPTFDLVSIDELAGQSDVASGVRYSCGEGGLGSDGFLACASLVTGDLAWIAFLQHANPFVRLTLTDRHVEVTNNHGHIWEFGKQNPLDITVR